MAASSATRRLQNGNAMLVRIYCANVTRSGTAQYLSNGCCWVGRCRRGIQLRPSFGDRTFAVARPRIWNSLPPPVRDRSLSHCVFAKRLKVLLVGPTGACDV